MITVRRWARILWAGLLSVLSLVESSVHWCGIAVLCLDRHWCFGIGRLLPRVPHGISFTDKSTTETVVT